MAVQAAQPLLRERRHTFDSPPHADVNTFSRPPCDHVFRSRFSTNTRWPAFSSMVGTASRPDTAVDVFPVRTRARGADERCARRERGPGTARRAALPRRLAPPGGVGGRAGDARPRRDAGGGDGRPGGPGHRQQRLPAHERASEPGQRRHRDAGRPDPDRLRRRVPPRRRRGCDGGRAGRSRR